MQNKISFKILSNATDSFSRIVSLTVTEQGSLAFDYYSILKHYSQ